MVQPVFRLMAKSISISGTATDGTADVLVFNRTEGEKVNDVTDDFPFASLRVQLSFVYHISVVCAE